MFCVYFECRRANTHILGVKAHARAPLALEMRFAAAVPASAAARVHVRCGSQSDDTLISENLDNYIAKENIARVISFLSMNLIDQV